MSISSSDGESGKKPLVSISTIGVDKRQKRGGSDRQTDRQTENYLLRAPITWRKYIFLHNVDLLRVPITWRKYIFLDNGDLLRAPITWRKYIFLHNGDLLRAPITWRKYIFLDNGDLLRAPIRQFQLSQFSFNFPSPTVKTPTVYNAKEISM